MIMYALNRDCCPKRDMILKQDSCKNCKHYAGFSIENGIPCIHCRFYNDLDATKFST